MKKLLKNNSCKSLYSDVWKTIKEAKDYIYGAIFIFFLFSLIGYFFPYFFYEEIMSMIQGMINEFIGLSIFETIIKIFLNNSLAGFFALVLGFFLGIVPIMIAIVNGYLIGFVANMVVSQEGVLVLWRLLPHGIFELPAIFISIGLGIWLGMGVFYDVKTLKHRLVSGLKVFLALILPLLVIAAIVEGILIGIGA